MQQQKVYIIQEITQDKILIKESRDPGTKEKSYYIEGVFMQADTPNKNNRLYPLKIMEEAVIKYNSHFVKTRRALGELGHPNTATVNPERVSHIITELKQNGKDIYGKAKILDTPYGQIVKNFIKEGVQLGVSSRGVGSLQQENGLDVVQNDFQICTVDIVTDPSAPGAFVDGIMEAKELWVKPVGEQAAETIVKDIKKNKITIVEAFERYLDIIATKSRKTNRN